MKRWCPARAFPAYAFIPGVNPHPRAHPRGHSFHQPEEKPSYLPPVQWAQNQAYLFGVDLYAQGFFWEAHELWEALWHLTQKEDVEGQFLQGLIQNAAAQLKIVVKQWEGARHLSREAYQKLLFVARSRELDGEGKFMGLVIKRFLQLMEKHYESLWKGLDQVEGFSPALELK